MSIRTQTITLNDQWGMPGGPGLENVWPGMFAKDNADVNGSGTNTGYGKVKGGTVLAEDSNGKLHPAGLAELTVLVSSAVAITVGTQNAPAFVVGDLVRVISYRTTRTIAITGEADTEVFTSATVHGLKVGDQVAISGLTGGSGATAGTYTVATVPSDTTFTLTGVAYTTDISSGTLTITLAEPIAVDMTTTDRNVVTSASGVVTVDGSAFSAAVGDLLVKVNAYKPVGILNDTIRTRRYVDDVEVLEDAQANVALERDCKTAFVIGAAGAFMQRLLNGAPYRDPLNPQTLITPKFKGFRFRDVR